MSASPTVPAAGAGVRPANRRRRFLSRPADQFRTSLVPTLGAAVLLVLLLAAAHGVNAARTRELVESNPAFGDLLEVQATSMETTLAALSIFYLFGILAVGLVHSRRLMGALFAMHRRIRRLAEGDLDSKLRLRRNDYFHDVAESIGQAASSFRRQAQQDLADLDDLLSIVNRSPAAGSLKEGVRTTLEEMRDRKRRLLGIEAGSEAASRPAPAGAGR